MNKWMGTVYAALVLAGRLTACTRATKAYGKDETDITVQQGARSQSSLHKAQPRVTGENIPSGIKPL